MEEEEEGNSPHMPAAPLLLALIFHSMATSPAVGPRAVNSKSEISTVPTSPLLPTLTMTCGFCMSSKRLPEATICDQQAPTMMEPGGICSQDTISFFPSSDTYVCKYAQKRYR